MSVFTGRRLGRLIADRTGQPALAHDADVVGSVLPFRVSAHVADELIDWSRAPDDPLYRLVMPHRDMLDPADFAAVEHTLRTGDRDRSRLVVDGIRERLSRHSGGWGGGSRTGDGARTGDGGGAGGGGRAGDPYDPYDPDPCDPYDPPDLWDPVGPCDPLLTRTALLDACLTPLLDQPRVHTVRIGTRAVSFSPARFLDAPDADDLLRLFERIVDSGRHLALMLHVTHPRELRPEAARRALRRLRATGAILRTRAPVLRHVNDDADTWARMWREQLELGLFPYSLSAVRGTGPRRYFGLPLARTLEVCTAAARQVPELARPACGPVMSTALGTLAVDGIAHLDQGPAFALRALWSRDPALTGRVAHARYDPRARWWDELVPYGPGDRTLIPGEPLTVEDVTGLSP
ncbi:MULTISPECIES: hypothetical protein [unclassified Streptomyces]|uniref:hypothetical protein n=1 Tax=unclassified Streptomyces TaxID=2593676 RepID=UPI000701A893|nr:MULTISPECIES: hypothetical protein [unclassified Streptomyces]KQX59469.1 lysine 2,3-aminomutase [Streptomyces sp. Root1304]KRB00728.1 lysine 2,3-aminomutase [Streptomyces sp. Root66D1]